MVGGCGGGGGERERERESGRRRTNAVIITRLLGSMLQQSVGG